MARATENRLACHFGHACHRFANAAVVHLRSRVLRNWADGTAVWHGCRLVRTSGSW